MPNLEDANAGNIKPRPHGLLCAFAARFSEGVPTQQQFSDRLHSVKHGAGYHGQGRHRLDKFVFGRDCTTDRASSDEAARRGAHQGGRPCRLLALRKNCAAVQNLRTNGGVRTMQMRTTYPGRRWDGAFTWL